MKKTRITAVMIAFILIFLIAVPAYAAETAQAVKLEKTEGTVNVAKNSEKPVSLRDGMRLYNGYIITTDLESYAWISLDDSKLIKLDASSSAEIRKNGSLLEVNVIKGSAFFDVSEKLTTEESLNIRTSTMAVGIRGTSGWVNARDNMNSDIILLEGTSLCAVSDPVTNQIKSAVLNGGDAAVCVVYPQDKRGDKCDILMGSLAVKDIPGYVLEELVNNVALCDKILEESGIDILGDLAKTAGGDPSGRSSDGKSASDEVLGEAARIKKEAESEAALKQQQIDEIILQTENNASLTNVWGAEDNRSQQTNTKEPEAEAPAVISEAAAATVMPAESQISEPVPEPSTESEPIPEESQTPEESPQPDPIVYTITLDAHGGTVSPTAITTDESGVLASLPTPTRENCTFLGWYNASTGGTQVTAPHTFTQNTTLYAQWKGWRREGDTVYIFGPGAMDDYTSTGPWGSDVKSAVIEDGVTNVGNNAFLNCTALTSISLAPSVETIGENAFRGCTALSGGSVARAAGLELPEGLKSIGNSAFYGCTALQNVSFPSSLTSIGNNAFESSGLSTVSVPSSVGSIGYGAFQRCTNLTSATLAGGTGNLGISVFADCSALTAAVLPSGIKSIPDYMFARCSKLENVNIPNGVQSIGSTAFSGCSSLTSIEIPNGVISIGALAFSSCGLNSINIPNSVTTIGNSAFSFTPLTSAVIPDSVTSLGGSVFDRCYDLTSVKLPVNITEIGSYTFYNCYNLADIEIPDKVTSIGSSAFQGCNNLESLIMPSSLTSLGTAVFTGCVKLKSITFNGNAPSVGGGSLGTNVGTTSYDEDMNGNQTVSYSYSSYYYTGATGFTTPIWAGYPCGDKNLAAFTVDSSGTLTGFDPDKYNGTDVIIPLEVNGRNVMAIGYQAFKNCNSLNSVIIPGDIESINQQAFVDCSGLTSVTISDGVEGISGAAFANCTGLKTVIIPDSVTYLGYAAFQGCTGLISVKLPANLTDIQWQMFADCKNLTEIEIPNNVKTISMQAFYRCENLTKIEIPNAVTSIEYDAFSGCSSLQSLVMPSSLTELGSNVFSDCMKLKNIIFNGNAPSINGTNGDTLGSNLGTNVDDGYVSLYYPGATGFTDPWAGYPAREINTAAFTVSAGGTLTAFDPSLYGSSDVVIPSQIGGTQIKTIGASAFTNCTTITSVVIPDGVTEIAGNPGNISGAFSGCTSLTSVSIPNSVTTIGDAAFYGCSKLTAVNIPNNVTDIHPYTFAGCSSLASITLPSALESINQAAFQSCSSLTSLVIPTSVTNIGTAAFMGCTGLVSTNVPSGVTTIKSQTFAYCSNLDAITLPRSLTKIENDAFKECSSLKTINYGGSIADWISLDKGNLPSGITIKCTDGDYTGESVASLASVMSLDEPIVVTFDANGGEVSENTYVTDAKGTLASYPVPTREGYEFSGWYSEPEGGERADENTVFAENITLYAHWNKIDIPVDTEEQNVEQNDLPENIEDTEADNTFKDDQSDFEPINVDTEGENTDPAELPPENSENAEDLIGEEQLNEPPESEPESPIDEGSSSEPNQEEPMQETEAAENSENPADADENVLLSARSFGMNSDNTLQLFTNKVLKAWSIKLFSI